MRRPHRSSEEALRHYRNLLAVRWRELYIEHGGEPPEAIWAEAKAALNDEHVLVWLLRETFNGVRVDKVWEQACAELQL